MKKLLIHFSVLLVLATLLSSCGGRHERSSNSGGEKGSDTIIDNSIPLPVTTYNFYVENSASMKGFLNGNTTLKQVIKEYYDRIDALQSPITLNLVNNSIVRKNKDIEDYLNNLYRNCNAKWSELDKILAIAMDTLGPNEVNLVISDYCFESPNGTFAMAQSGITKLFQKRLNTGKDLAVAIFKYNCDFNGITYPSKKKCNHEIPAYVWAFGSTRQIKDVSKLPIKINSECMILEPWKEFQPEFIDHPSRMVKNNEIVVKHWKKERNSDFYKLSMKLDLSKLAINESFLIDTNNYSITEGFEIDQITRVPETDIYIFELSTKHPSPCDVTVNLVNNIPQWVYDSNYEDMNTAPDAGKTLGIKYLIEGVYDAYNYSNKNIFTVKIKLI